MGRIRKSVCADVSKNMLKACTERLRHNNVDVTPVHVRSLPLPFPDDEFDAVLAFETIEHMPAPEAFLAELARVLKPGGELVLSTPNILWEPFHWCIAIFNLHHSEGPRRFLRRRTVLRKAHSAGLRLERERSSVLTACGIPLLDAMDRFLCRLLPQAILRWLALRRIFILRTAKSTGAS